MSIYSKKLRNLRDLEQEQARLLNKKDKLERSALASTVAGGKGKKGNKSKEGVSSIGAVIDYKMIGSLVLELLKSRNARKEKEATSYTSIEKGTVPVTESVKEPASRQNLAVRLAWEIGGGYLKWKAIEVTVKGINKLIGKVRDQRG